MGERHASRPLRRAYLLVIAAIFASGACTRPPPPADEPGSHAQAAATRAGRRRGGERGAPAAVAQPARGVTDPDAALRAAVPRIDAAMKARLRALYQRGQSRGLRATVFAKIGDSITESASFLQDIGRGWYDLGPHGDLADTVAYFHRTAVDADGNDSFAHASAAATAGWTAADALEGSPPPVARELDALRPAFALVMFGTNDLDRRDADAFARDLDRVVAECESRGVIAVLSTIPARLDTREAGARVPAFNDRIARVAASRGVPLMDLHGALAPLPRYGIDPDGIHPNAYATRDGDTRTATFTPEAMRHGYNARNLLALRTLAKLRAVVVDDGAPDR